MKKQLKKLQDLIIEKIKNEEYEVKHTDMDINYFSIKIEIEELTFHYSIPMHKKYLVEHSNSVLLNNETLNNGDIAELLLARHFEPIKNQEIEKKIAELQKQLK